MPFWAHFILGYLISVVVATFVTLGIFIIGIILDTNSDPDNIIILMFFFGFVITSIAGFPGFTLAVYIAGTSIEKSCSYWIIAGLINAALSLVLFYIFAAAIFSFVLIPLALAGGAAGGCAYFLFRDKFPLL